MRANLQMPKAFSPLCARLLVPRRHFPCHCVAPHSRLLVGSLRSHSVFLSESSIHTLCSRSSTPLICTIFSRRASLYPSDGVSFASWPMGFSSTAWLQASSAPRETAAASLCTTASRSKVSPSAALVRALVLPLRSTTFFRDFCSGCYLCPQLSSILTWVQPSNIPFSFRPTHPTTWRSM